MIVARTLRKIETVRLRLRRIWCRWYQTNLARARARHCGRNLRVNGPSRFTSHCSFGSNCNFNGMTVRGKGTVVFGNNFHSGENCRIITQNHNYDHGTALPYDATYVLKTVTIGDNVWFGDCVLVVGNVTIGEGAILAAGAVVSKDVPACAIVAGNPARIVKYRDRGHYEALKGGTNRD